MFCTVIGQAAHAKLTHSSQPLHFGRIDQVENELVYAVNPNKPVNGIAKHLPLLFDQLFWHGSLSIPDLVGGNERCEGG